MNNEEQTYDACDEKSDEELIAWKESQNQEKEKFFESLLLIK